MQCVVFIEIEYHLLVSIATLISKSCNWGLIWFSLLQLLHFWVVFSWKKVVINGKKVVIELFYYNFWAFELYLVGKKLYLSRFTTTFAFLSCSSWEKSCIWNKNRPDLTNFIDTFRLDFIKSWTLKRYRLGNLFKDIENLCNYNPNNYKVAIRGKKVAIGVCFTTTFESSSCNSWEISCSWEYFTTTFSFSSCNSWEKSCIWWEKSCICSGK